MCMVCGCGDTSSGRGTAEQSADVRVDPTTGDLHYGAGSARVSVPGLSAQRAIRLEADVLSANNRIAATNRTHFATHRITALNLVSSPGAGKTALLVASIEALRRRARATDIAVIEGDQQTSNDAERIRAAGAPAIQVNTGKGCHLDARMVGDAFARLPLHGHHHDHEHAGDHAHEHRHHDLGALGVETARRLLFIENVGNLVCPALWDLGEAAKVAILSVTEGDDKPLKYPDMFAAARLMLLNKVDLLPYVDFDLVRCIEYARSINPAIEVIPVSATRGDGIDAWLDWIEQAALQPRESAAARA